MPGPFNLLPLTGKLPPGHVYRVGRGAVVAVPAPPQPREGKAMGEEKKEKRQVVTLKRAQAFKLAALMTEWKNEILKTQPTKASIAERATTALGIKVTESIVRHTATDLGWGGEWRATRGQAGGSPLTKPHIYGRMKLAEAQLKLLRDAVLSLTEQVGGAVPMLSDESWPKMPPKTAENPAESAGNG